MGGECMQTRTSDYFGPIRAKAAVRRAHPNWTNDQVSRAACGSLGEGSTKTGHFNSEIATLFPDSFQNSELGEVPKGWRVAALSDFADLNPETWTRTTRPEVIRYVDLSNTKWGRIEDVVVHQHDEAPSRAQRVHRCGDTVVGTVRPGNGSYALVADEGLTGSTGFAVLRPHRTEFTEFVYLATTTRENIDRLAH